MHLLTITVHSNLFGETIDDFTLECMAYEYLEEAKRLLVAHELDGLFRIEAYWGRGSLIEHFLLILENAPVIEMFSASMAYKGLKEYKQIRESVILMASDLKSFKTAVSGKKVSTRDSLVSETKPTRNTKKIEKKPVKEDDQRL